MYMHIFSFKTQPFRRLCVDYGAEITCGESQYRDVSYIYITNAHGTASSGTRDFIPGGSKEEWSLVRRHPSESIFGVQIAGNKPATMVPTAEVIAKECAGNVDFVDINCGCPIDLVFRTGSGSARTPLFPCTGLLFSNLTSFLFIIST
jgi:tRNA-dihydrouridine synthase 3